MFLTFFYTKILNYGKQGVTMTLTKGILQVLLASHTLTSNVIQVVNGNLDHIALTNATSR